MSTLFRTSRLLNWNLLLPAGLALSLVFGLTGCSSTSGRRTGVASKMKTFLSVGDKPLPVVTGEPGSIVAAESGSDADGESLSPRRRVRPDGRISGRVYDADNHPVPDARVRLAVSGASGGKVVSATTDRSGAFTLHGLRPGSDYTVIAEWDGESGLETGRADARTSDTDVRISLGQSDEPPARASAPARVNRVSDREAGDEDQPDAKSRPAANVNEEDLPPAREAEAMETDTARSPRSRDSIATRPAGWRRGSDSQAPVAAPVDTEARGTAAPAVQPVSPLDDGENPLPPALEPIPESSAQVEPDPSGPEPRALPSEPDPFSTGGARIAASQTGPSIATRQPAASSPFESPTSPTEPTTEPRPSDAAPGALVVVPETFGPVVAHDSDPFAGFLPTGPDPAPPVRAARPARPKPPAVATATASASASKPAARATRTPRRPTWGEVVASIAAPEAGSVTRADERSPSGAGVATRAVALQSDEPARSQRASRPVKTAFNPAECEYDDRLRRIIDFRLPDLKGKSVRFQDLDSDLVLIDFWGTWCPPCLRSMPHLIELQERMGTRLKVVGIACESEAPEVSSPKVADAVRKMNIPYPILLSRNDGSCPLQEALHIQAYPTMILVDRQGRVLWRDQGATPATLARLDRVVDSSTQVVETRRY